MIINGHTELIAHSGFSIHAYKAPMIYNRWFKKTGINVIVVSMACQVAD